MLVLEKFKEYCNDCKIDFENNSSIKSYQQDTLFCIAGMQKYKDIFLGKEKAKHSIIANNQAVLRYNDIDEIGDSTHYAYFNMLGYFDFSNHPAQHKIDNCVLFWFDFLERLDISTEDTGFAIKAHKKMKKYDLPVDEYDDSLIWESGTKGTDNYTVGYSTEFYINNVEIGNIVLLENGMVDCGFGLERLEMLYNKDYTKPTEEEILTQTAEKIIECGYFPKSNGKQEFILWDCLKRLYKLTKKEPIEWTNYIVSEEFINAYTFVKNKYEENQAKYEKLKDKYPDKDKNWWKETMGVYLD